MPTARHKRLVIVRRDMERWCYQALAQPHTSRNREWCCEWLSDGARGETRGWAPGL